MNMLRFHLERNGREGIYGGWDAKLFADDVPVNEGWHIDWVDLATSAFLDGDYFPLTCSCGVPQCARIHEPVRVAHEGNAICWHIIEPKPERRFRFDREQYRMAILDFLREVQRTVPRSKRGGKFNFGHACFRVTDLDWCIKTLDTGISDQPDCDSRPLQKILIACELEFFDYASIKPASDVSSWSGLTIATYESGLSGKIGTSRELDADMDRWVLEWIQKSPNQQYPGEFWEKFHEEGIVLATRLKAEVGDRYAVEYRAPWGDPVRGGDKRLITLILGDGRQEDYKPTAWSS